MTSSAQLDLADAPDEWPWLSLAGQRFPPENPTTLGPIWIGETRPDPVALAVALRREGMRTR